MTIEYLSPMQFEMKVEVAWGSTNRQEIELGRRTCRNRWRKTQHRLQRCLAQRRDELRAKEKLHMRSSDGLAAERRRLPWVRVEKSYRFECQTGSMSLTDLFAGQRQLIVYHHMLRPADPSPCAGCAMFGDQIPHLAHLRARNTSLAFVSRAPIVEIEAFRARMGWTVPWYETTDSFNPDFDVKGGFGVNVFYQDGGGAIYRTYFATNRAAETLGTIWAFLDLTRLGRQETWENSPEGTPQSTPYVWWRLHDEY